MWIDTYITPDNWEIIELVLITHLALLFIQVMCQPLIGIPTMAQWVSIQVSLVLNMVFKFFPKSSNYRFSTNHI